jgi:hypothetical protein
MGAEADELLRRRYRIIKYKYIYIPVLLRNPMAEGEVDP